MSTRIFNNRISSVDLLRGIVMVLMAIDHVRVYSGIPAGGSDYGIFFTRWVTNFCAPAFAFLAGSGIFFYAQSGRTRNQLVRYLLLRGLLLVLLELTVIRFCWTFNFNYGEFTLAGIIWMLGWCMIGMAALTALPAPAVGVIGMAIVLLQPFFAQPSFGPFWEFIYPSGLQAPWGVHVLYVLVPWIGVMAMGYGIGPLFRLDPAKRNRIFRTIGLSAIAVYGIVGIFITARQPAQDNQMPFLLRLLNQRKYPASPLFLLMTLGPVMTALPWAEQAKGRLAQILTTFGRVPFFFYLLHIPTIHLVAMGIDYLREGTFGSQWYGTAPGVYIPPELRWPLWLLYLEWAAVIVFLYYCCRWFARYKNDHPEKRWLRFL